MDYCLNHWHRRRRYWRTCFVLINIDFDNLLNYKTTINTKYNFIYISIKNLKCICIFNDKRINTFIFSPNTSLNELYYARFFFTFFVKISAVQIIITMIKYYLKGETIQQVNTAVGNCFIISDVIYNIRSMSIYIRDNMNTPSR